ncbi:MAG: hypothetical protein JRF39_01675 [Deltaproteobacteria bacterium]|nr:hypothetical protein [Deltaproteobacteria bacterium]
MRRRGAFSLYWDSNAFALSRAGPNARPGHENHPGRFGSKIHSSANSMQGFEFDLFR